MHTDRRRNAYTVKACSDCSMVGDLFHSTQSFFWFLGHSCLLHLTMSISKFEAKPLLTLMMTFRRDNFRLQLGHLGVWPSGSFSESMDGTCGYNLWRDILPFQISRYILYQTVHIWVRVNYESNSLVVLHKIIIINDSSLYSSEYTFRNWSGGELWMIGLGRWHSSNSYPSMIFWRSISQAYPACRKVIYTRNSDLPR